MGKNYSELKKRKAYNLMKECGAVSISGRLGRGDKCVRSIGEVANQNLPTVINDLKSLRERLYSN